jgi:type II secretory pathway pseudopilin PulG
LSSSQFSQRWEKRVFTVIEFTFRARCNLSKFFALGFDDGGSFNHPSRDTMLLKSMRNRVRVTAINKSHTPTRKPGRGFTKKQRGVALIDLGIALGALAVLIAIVVALAAYVTTGSDNRRVEQELIGINTATKAAFATQSTYGSAALTTYLSNSADIPSTLKRTVSGSTVTLNNKWNGAVAVTGNNATFTVQYDGVPKAICNKVLTRLTSPEWNSVTVGSTAVTLPVTPAGADAACTATNNLTLVAG